MQNSSVDYVRLNNLKDYEINQFFEVLLNNCKDKGIYSVLEEVEKMGVPYSKVLEWSMSNEDWNYKLKKCRCLCSSHAHNDWAFFKLSDKLGLKYCLENDDEFACHYQKKTITNNTKSIK